MKALTVVVGLLLAATLGVGQLRELTQNGADEQVAGTETVVEVDVATRDFPRGDETAVRALWTVCAATVPGEVSDPMAAAGDDGPWMVTISPALGEHGRKRLVGCLEDGTIERVVGHVESISPS